MMSLKDTGVILWRIEEKMKKTKKKHEEGNFYLLWNDCKVLSKVLLSEFSITIKKKWMLEKKFFFKSIDDGWCCIKPLFIQAHT